MSISGRYHPQWPILHWQTTYSTDGCQTSQETGAVTQIHEQPNYRLVRFVSRPQVRYSATSSSRGGKADAAYHEWIAVRLRGETPSGAPAPGRRKLDQQLATPKPKASGIKTDIVARGSSARSDRISRLPERTCGYWRRGASKGNDNKRAYTTGIKFEPIPNFVSVGMLGGSVS